MLKWKIRSLSHSIPGDIQEKEIARVASMFAEGIKLYVSKKRYYSFTELMVRVPYLHNCGLRE